MENTRSNRLDLQTPIEKKIWELIAEIETLGADERLTNAQTYLSQAKAELSDYIDEKDKKEIELRKNCEHKESIWDYVEQKRFCTRCGYIIV